jgi:hypothetical protein
MRMKNRIENPQKKETAASIEISEDCKCRNSRKKS